MLLLYSAMAPVIFGLLALMLHKNIIKLMYDIGAEKLALFAPNDKKYTFNVMPFGPTNALDFYIAMMKDLKDEWDELCIIRITALASYKNNLITLSAANGITIAGKPVVWGSKAIIDNILLWCDIREFTLMLFKYACEVF